MLNWRLAAGLLILFAALQGAAMAFRSMLGEWGLLIAALVVGLAWAVQRYLHKEKLSDIGLRRETRGLWIAGLLSAALIGVAAIYVLITGAPVTFYPDFAWLALGILAQGGIAEELTFRGYLYGHLRRTRSFWRAALVSMAPFAAVHLLLFATMPWPIALAALLLSVALSFPYARLYELGGRTIWAPALVHAVTQAGPKLVVIDEKFPLVWMGAAFVITWCAFLFNSADDSRT